MSVISRFEVGEDDLDGEVSIQRGTVQHERMMMRKVERDMRPQWHG
jgi:hypothetical protein